MHFVLSFEIYSFIRDDFLQSSFCDIRSFLLSRFLHQIRQCSRYDWPAAKFHHSFRRPVISLCRERGVEEEQPHAKKRRNKIVFYGEEEKMGRRGRKKTDLWPFFKSPAHRNLRQLLHRDKKSLFHVGSLNARSPSTLRTADGWRKKDGRDRVGINRKSVDENRRGLGHARSRGLPLPVAGDRRHDVLSLAAENWYGCDLTCAAAAADLIDVKLKRGGKIGFARAAALVVTKGEEEMVEARVYLRDRLVSDHLYDAIKFRDEKILRQNIKCPLVNNVLPFCSHWCNVWLRLHITRNYNHADTCFLVFVIDTSRVI